MAGNSFGTLLRITTFGESHGPGIGVVLDGCPPGLIVTIDQIQSELNRRKPGQSSITTQRMESDEVQVLAGLIGDKTLGAPICLWIPNKDARPADYEAMKTAYRPSHADFTYDQKYGIREVAGGGRSSARETAARVAAGVFARKFLENQGVSFTAFVSQVGAISCPDEKSSLDFELIEKNIVRCPHSATAEKMISYIEEVRAKGDSTGGEIRCLISNCPPGLGEPVYDKLDADLAKAMLSINATKGFSIGSGFMGVSMLGSEHNDAFVNVDGAIRTETNYSGGVQGGISNGMDIDFRVAFKPTSTIAKSQKTVSPSGDEAMLEGKGRHDPCVVPRAVPIVEAMAALVLADHLLRHRALVGRL